MVKCLMDYGFYVLIMFFLVLGMLMVELIESELKVELDCFVEVMLSIRVEIGKVESGVWLVEDNLLKWVLYILVDVIGIW